MVFADRPRSLVVHRDSKGARLRKRGVACGSAGLELLQEVADRQLVQLAVFRMIRQPLLDVFF